MTTSTFQNVGVSKARPISSSSTVVDQDIQTMSESKVETKATPLVWKDDPLNPHNWKPSRKYAVTILLSAFTFNTLMSSTMVAPALSQISKDLVIQSDAKTQLVLSIYVLAYAAGYFFWAPMSEIYGRVVVLQVANAWFCIWNLVCGFAPNLATITVGRLFSGAGAASSLALGTGVMGEIWLPSQRGRSLAVLSVITLLGPTIGPIIGGAIAAQSSSSWRWAFWATTIFNAMLQLMSFRFLHESHVPTILAKKSRAYSSRCVTNIAIPVRTRRTTGKILLTSLKRPFYLLLSQPASQGLVLHSGIAFGGLYIVLSILTKAFTEVYHQKLTIASLNYISFGVGMTFGAQICAPVIDTIYRNKSRQYAEARQVTDQGEKALNTQSSESKVPAELRLYPFIPTVILTAVGLVLLGWSIHFRTHWIVPNIGLAIFGAGSQATTQCTNAYMIDTFSEIKSPVATVPTTNHAENDSTAIRDISKSQISINWSASAMASIWSVKSVGGFAFPLFSLDMFETLGWGWSGTLLAGLNLIIGIPVAVMLLVYGSKLRETGRRRIEKRMELGRL